MIVPQSIPPQESNAFTVNINHSNGVNESFKFFIVDENLVANQEQEEEIRIQQSVKKTSIQSVQPKGWGSWSNWTYYWAGTHDDQRLYGQFKVNGCWSGCGATAWAMLFLLGGSSGMDRQFILGASLGPLSSRWWKVSECGCRRSKISGYECQ